MSLETDVTAAEGWFQAEFDLLKAKAVAAWQAFEGDVVAVAKTVAPEIETDVEQAIEAFGEDLVNEAVSLFRGGATTGSTASQLTTSVVQKVEAQGESIAIGTAQLVGNQVAVAVASGLKTVAAQVAAAKPQS